MTTENKVLLDIAKQINEREIALAMLRANAESSATQVIAEALLQGQDLILARSHVSSDNWPDWLKAHCPKTVRLADRYTSAARRADKLQDVRGAYRQLLLFSKGDPDPNRITRQRSPELTIVYRLSLLLKAIEAHPIDKWSASIKDDVMVNLGPIVSALWGKKHDQNLAH